MVSAWEIPNGECLGEFTGAMEMETLGFAWSYMVLAFLM